MSDATETQTWRLTQNRHPSIHSIAKFIIANDKLPGAGYNVALEFEEMTNRLVQLIEQDSPELTSALRKLLEAKDCAVRAVLDEQPGFWTDR